MNQSNAGPDPNDLGYGAWFAFWGQLIVLALFAVLGGWFASDSRAPGDAACGLTLSLAAIALAFLRLKSRFDGAGGNWASFLLVDNMTSLVAAIVVFAALALAGLATAGSVDHGGLHDAGVALAAVSALAVFLSIKHVFDTQERSR